MNRQLTMNGLILAALIFATVLIFSYMVLRPNPVNILEGEGSYQVEQRVVNPYDIPAQ